MLETLTFETFAPLQGDAFALHAPPEASITLTLVAVRSLGERPGGRDPFALDFRGPASPVLPQRIYALAHPELGELEIFIVPVGATAGGVDYEAIFT